MSLIDKFFIKKCNKLVGTDCYGNSYYLSKEVDYLGKARRLVVYNGLDEPSKVPPLWHAWLHYLSDEIPDGSHKPYSWQKEHLPNLTGTKHAYSSNASRVSADYTPWDGA